MVEKLGTAAMLELAVLSMKDSLFDLVSICTFRVLLVNDHEVMITKEPKMK